MPPRTTNRSGIVLRRRVTPAGDIMVSLLTPQGKVRAIVRSGLRRNGLNSAHASRLSLFHHVGLQLYQTPNGDLATVQQAVLEGALPTLAQPERHTYAHLSAELAELLFQEGEQSSEAFELVAGALRGIAHHPDPEWVALVMTHKLLGLAGFVPRVSQCARCGAADPAHPDPHGGLLLCRACSGLPPLPAATLDFRRSVMRRSVRASMETPLPPEFRPELWRSLERFVTLQVGQLRSWPQFQGSGLRAPA
ncbi:DNA repair protein RecO [Deinococcus lacus]|uniref:DNA repair protein RecO n=1 Tax=Deinococcus lacus TaxID=392561 RepID=A0ABW1YAD1_9DEIO